ncbi:hypothetical protein BKG94_05350 [Rodentibacter ratti]|uniref:hypothetical protein n=1 Tax=Rodentibacter ratti TaxID=1906745 RepID=UPI000984571D|nr:hypothetical protein [Rodentibacter ratti]OOF88568.1 hypothetical protein BKG94_05350 [Rodentibacter ratti]
MYLYEGLPEKGKTRILDPELVRAGVSPIEVSLSKEICVASDIKIKPLGKVRITYDSDIEDWHKAERIKKVEMLG